MSEPTILIFARAPEAGKTKTRLIPALGKQGAARLHAQLIRRTVEEAVAARTGRVELWCTPSKEHAFFFELERDYDVQRRLQQGADLGERMLRTFDSVLANTSAAVLVGSDSPDLGAADFKTAMAALSAGYDAVLGPAADGGYVLIGLRQPAPLLFRDMPWGTSDVLNLTRERLGSLGWKWDELPLRHDLDRPEDLSKFPFIHEWISEAPC